MSYHVLSVGEILWDFLPAGRQLGGAPANFAYHLHALGADVRLVSRVGDDSAGREILARIALLGLPITGIGVDESAPTGTASVELVGDGQPHFIIHEDVAWDRLTTDVEMLVCAGMADAVYFGSLAQRSDPSRRSICRIIAAAPPSALRVFDINLRPPFYSREIIEFSLSLANALKLSDAELPVLAKMFGLAGGTREQLSALARRFNLRAIALTRGAAGSLLLADGVWSDHSGLRVPVVDAVGAGDSFTAAWTLGLLAGMPLDEINFRANELAAFVCTQPGAMPENCRSSRWQAVPSLFRSDRSIMGSAGCVPSACGQGPASA
jgi:fructokinase